MSENNELPRITLKGGTGYDAPWITIPFTNPNEAVQNLGSLRASGLLEAVVETSNLFHSVNTLAPVLPNAPQAAPAPAPQQQSAPPGWAQTPAPQQPQAAGHPEGKVCASCQSPLQFKQGTSQKGNAYKLWACPNGRSRNDGHTSEFVN